MRIRIINPRTKYLQHKYTYISFIWHYLIFMLYLVLWSGCYQPVATFESIGIRSEYTSNNEESGLNHDKDKTQASKPSKNYQTKSKEESSQQHPFIFYKECNKSGAIWLYECQRLGLESIYDAFKLELPQTTYLYNIMMFFYIKESFILYEVRHNGKI